MFKKKKKKRSPPRIVEIDPAVKAGMEQYMRLQRKYALEALQRSIPNFRICMTCQELFESRDSDPNQPRQRCDCDPDRARGWSGDLRERARLCECCGPELLPSGSRSSVWFCAECRERVARVGRCKIPIGRHSFMAGIGVPGRALVDANPEEFSAIVEALRVSALGWLDSMHHLHAFADDRLRHLARRADLDQLDAIPLDTFFERVAATGDAELGKPAAFHSVARWFADGALSTFRHDEGDNEAD
jgi:hypothetical protein